MIFVHIRKILGKQMDLFLITSANVCPWDPKPWTLPSTIYTSHWFPHGREKPGKTKIQLHKKKKRQRNTTPNLCVDVRSSDVVGRFNFTAQYSASNSLGLVAWLLGSCLLQRVPVQVESLQLQPCMLTHKRQYLFCLT